MEDIIDIIVTETTNLIEITSQPTDEIIDVNIIDNREDVTLNVTPTLVEININSLTGNFGILWGEIEGTLSNQTDLQNALNLKADLVDGKVPSSQLPSYVDDVVEVANYAALPVTGEVGKIYITLDTNYIYRWTGSTYVEIKDSSAVWGAITGTLSNQTDLQNALNAKQDDLNGTGFVKASGTTITYDNTSYLPLTGGTLTGNLLGTNITISNSLIAKGGTFNGGALSGGVVTIDGLGSDLLMNRADTSNGASITLLTNAVEKWNIGLRSAGTTDNFFIYNSTLLANALTINSATSAATFASSATATNFILSGGTGNTGLYYGHTDRVVLANYTTGGIDFEVNEGSIVATLFPSGNYGLGIALDAGYKLDVNGTTRISGALSGTSATFSGLITSNTGFATNALNGYTLKNDANSANIGGLVRKKYWFGGTDDSPVIFAETGYTLGFYVDGSISKGLSIATSGAATFSSSVTATSVGINVSTISNKLTVANTAGLPTTSTLTEAIASFQDSGSNRRLGIGASSSGQWIQSSQPTVEGIASVLLLNPSGGNVGIGTTSPIDLLTLYATSQPILSLRDAGVNSNYGGYIKGFGLSGAGGQINIGVIDNNTYRSGIEISEQLSTIIFKTSASATERMRISSGGNVFVGTTSQSGNSDGGSTNVGVIIEGPNGTITSQRNNDANIYLSKASGFSSGLLINFYTGGTARGSISTNGISVSYNMTSDYRIKEDLKPIKGLEIVNKINVYDYKYKSSDVRMDGVLAHELQEVLPYAVTGVKDGEQMQSVDYSKIVPVLIQSIKELKSKIETLENK